MFQRAPEGGWVLLVAHKIQSQTRMDSFLGAASGSDRRVQTNMILIVAEIALSATHFCRASIIVKMRAY